MKMTNKELQEELKKYDDNLLAAIRQREQAATKGPWTVEHDSDCAEYGPIVEFPHSIVGPRNIGSGGKRYEFRVSEISELSEEDAQFLAHARSDVPYLLDLVEGLRGEIALLNWTILRLI